MKVLIGALIGVCLLVLSEADPIPGDINVKDNEVQTSLIAEQQLASKKVDLTPHSREKRSKKEALAYYLNQYLYGNQPPPQRYPRRGYGNRGYGQRGYPDQYGQQYPPYYGYDDDYYYGEEEKGKRHGGAGKALKKLKKFG